METKVELSRSKDGRWHIEGVGMVWEKDLIKELKEIVPEEDEWK